MQSVDALRVVSSRFSYVTMKKQEEKEEMELSFLDAFLKMGVFSGQNLFLGDWWSNVKTFFHLKSLELLHKGTWQESVQCIVCYRNE